MPRAKPDDRDIRIGLLARACRIERGMTLASTALRLNISWQALQKLERGGTQWSLHRVLQMSEIYGKSTDYFLTPTSGDDGNSLLQWLASEKGQRLLRAWGSLEHDSVGDLVLAVVEAIAQSRSATGPTTTPPEP